MDEDEPVEGRTIEATPRAREALLRLAGENGPLILHIPGGAEAAGSPMCLAAWELWLGPRDLLLGTVDDVPVYRMPEFPSGLPRDRHYVLDLVRGFPPGFSLSPAEGMAFSLREQLVK